MSSRTLGHRAPLLWLVLPLMAGLAAGKLGELAPAPWLLGSSPQSGVWAAELGLPYAFADFIAPGGAGIAQRYTASFTPACLAVWYASTFANNPTLLMSHRAQRKSG